MAPETTSDATLAGADEFFRFAADTADLAGLGALNVDWLWETDEDHRFTRISDGFRRCTGHEPAHFVRRSRLTGLRHQAGRDRAVAELLRAIEAREPFRDCVHFIEDRQGRSRPIAISGMPRFDDQGRFAGYRGTCRDLNSIMVHFETRDTPDSDSLAGRLMTGLDAIEDAFCCYDSAGRLMLHNAAMLDMYPVLEDVLMPGMTFEALISAALERGVMAPSEVSLDTLRATFAKPRLTGNPVQVVFQLADGRWVQCRIVPTADGGSVAIHTDITSQKQYQESLKQARDEAEAAKQRLQAGIDVLDDGFVIWDQEDRLAVFNEAYRKHFPYLEEIKLGWSAEELLRAFAESGGVSAAIGREEAWVQENLARRLIEIGQDIVFQTHGNRWILRRDLRTASGERVGVRKDLTEQKQRERELQSAKDSAEQLLDDMKSILDTLHMGVVVLDSDLNTTIINRAYFDLWGCSPDEVEVGISARDLFEKARERGVYVVPEDEWETYVAKRTQALRIGNISDQEIQRADGGTMIYAVRNLSGGRRLVTYYDVTTMKQREADLAAATERAELLLHDLERTLDAVDLGVVLLDPNLNAEMINTAFYRLWSLTPEQAPRGSSFDHIMNLNRNTGVYDIADDQWDGFVRWRMDEIRQGNVEPREFARADGKTVIYAVTELSGGKRLVTYFDVTSLKQREAELAEALERSRLAEAVLDSLSSPIFVKDDELNFVMANKAFAKILDTTPERMMGRRAVDFVDRDKAEEFEQTERNVLQHDEPFEIEEDYEEDGRPRTRMVRKNRVSTGAGRDYVAGFIFDVTDMKRRETDAVQARRYLANVLDSLPAGVVIYDADNRFVLANGNVHEALPAMVPAMQPGKPLREAVERAHAAGYFRHSDDPALDAIYDTDPAAWVEAYLARYDASMHVFERQNPDGRWFKAFDMRLEDGTFVGVRVDISELKAREAELSEAQQQAVLADRAKSEFLANMSHEIRTPMNGVLGMAELLSKSELDPKQKTFTDIILKSGQALLTIINDILDFSKIDAGQMVLDPAPFNLAEAIEDVAALMSTRAKEKDLEMIVRFEPGLPRQHVGDVGRIRQIITNLMGNAVKFTEAGHVLVDVTGKEVGDVTSLRISVADTGIGIPADKLDKVFEKFSQVDSSSTRRHEGTGLGLAITSRLIEMMGGEIGVESVEGQGSTFWFSIDLPRCDDQEQTRLTPVDVSGARVLVVDDNAVNRTILLEQMASWGFDSCAASSGAEGLEVLKAAASCGIKVDCIVLDHQMPGMTGIDMARRLRVSDGISETPVVLLTSVDQNLGTSVNAELGIDVQLTKPARSSALLEAIVKTIQKRRQHPLSADRRTRPEDTGTRDGAISRPTRHPTPAAQASATRQRAASDDGHQVDILVAEDNEVNQLVFTQILSDTDYTFALVRNGALALQAWREMNPRMILMDVSMPEMNGLEATSRIREAEEESERRTPVVGVTAHALKGDRERCLEAGMDDYLSKPISPKALLEKIDHWIGATSSEDRLEA